MFYIITKASQVQIKKWVSKLPAGSEVEIIAEDTFSDEENGKSNLPYINLEPSEKGGWSVLFAVGRILNESVEIDGKIGYRRAYTQTTVDGFADQNAIQACEKSATFANGKLVYGEGSGPLGVYLVDDKSAVILEVEDTLTSNKAGTGEYYRITRPIFVNSISLRKLGAAIISEHWNDQEKTNAGDVSKQRTRMTAGN
jgi:hypothetical protein